MKNLPILLEILIKRRKKIRVKKKLLKVLRSK
jgi:hypothetical protein